MIYDSKVLFEWSAGPETNNYGWYEVSKEAGKNVIDDTERAFIESTDLSPEAKKQVGQDILNANNEGLQNLQEQAKDIINSVKDNNYNNSDVIKAIQSLLRIHAIQNNLMTTWNVIAINGDLSSLKWVFWWEANFKNNYINELPQLKWIVWWTEIVKALNALFWVDENNIQTQQKYDAQLTQLESGTEAADFADMTDRMAVDLLTKYINSGDADGKTIAQFYKEHKWNNYAMYVVASVQKLFDLPVTWDPSNITEDVIKEKQREMQNDSAFNWMKKIDDWKLWIATLRALVNTNAWAEKPTFQNDNWKLDLSWNGVRESNEDAEKLKYTKIDMPTNMTELDDLWVWWDGSFSFYWETGNTVEWKDDYVWVDGNWEFVQIGDKRYHIDKVWIGAGTDLVRTKREIHTYEIDWEQRTEYVDVVRIGTFNENWVLIAWKEIKSDNWDQQSTEFFGSKPRGNDAQESHFWAVTLWENPEWSKWRIDLFWADWIDSKRFSKDQLNSLDCADCSSIIDQAIKMYDATSHKPSEVWRYNLNRIVYRILKDTQVYDALAQNYWTQFDTPKTASHMLLWMDTGFYTNPDKQLKQKHIENKDKDVADILKINLDGLKEAWYKEITEFTEDTTKWEQIKNRLLMLKAFLNTDAARSAIKDKVKAAAEN